MQPQREEAAHLVVRRPLLVPAPALKVGVRHGPAWADPSHYLLNNLRSALNKLVLRRTLELRTDVRGESLE